VSVAINVEDLMERLGDEELIKDIVPEFWIKIPDTSKISQKRTIVRNLNK
jgi:hypothetical protein